MQIHHVEHEQWLGSLLHANDELILALLTYEQLDHSVDADSDSEDELAEQAHLWRSTPTKPLPYCTRRAHLLTTLSGPAPGQFQPRLPDGHGARPRGPEHRGGAPAHPAAALGHLEAARRPAGAEAAVHD